MTKFLWQWTTVSLENGETITNNPRKQKVSKIIKRQGDASIQSLQEEDRQLCQYIILANETHCSDFWLPDLKNRNTSLSVYCFWYWDTLGNNWDHMWPCTQELLLLVLREPYRMLGTEPRLASAKQMHYLLSITLVPEMYIFKPSCLQQFFLKNTHG